ncbi:MAG: hypothetical protein DI537_14680 [Stutzerimonas stutzeri]|nr:MAG: hypothetical protein DI537_14680 [Stutzerimonas stutzeri]
MTEIPAFSPGCFGSAIAFKKDDAACATCQFFAKCQVVSETARDALRDRYGIMTTREAINDRIRKREEAKADRDRQLSADPAMLTVPKKVRELLDRLDRGNYDIVGKLKRGINPFGSAMPWMAIACHLLINHNQRVDQGFISVALERKLGWKKGTADAHARMAIQALTHVGAIESLDGTIAIRKD